MHNSSLLTADVCNFAWQIIDFGYEVELLESQVWYIGRIFRVHLLCAHESFQRGGYWTTPFLLVYTRSN